MGVWLVDTDAAADSLEYDSQPPYERTYWISRRLGSRPLIPRTRPVRVAGSPAALLAAPTAVDRPLRADGLAEECGRSPIRLTSTQPRRRAFRRQRWPHQLEGQYARVVTDDVHGGRLHVCMEGHPAFGYSTEPRSWCVVAQDQRAVSVALVAGQGRPAGEQGRWGCTSSTRPNWP